MAEQVEDNVPINKCANEPISKIMDDRFKN